jgi:hypothetical protein
MTAPHLTFFCELEPAALLDLLTPEVLEDLRALKARLSLGILDLSPERARAVRLLNQQGIPVIAWLLLPKDQGYYLNLDNGRQALSFYRRFQAWSGEHELKWAGIGLDIEPDVNEQENLLQNRQQMVRQMIRRAFKNSRLKEGRKAYRDLVAAIRADGYPVESYQFPVIADERRVQSNALQRLFSLVDVDVDKEVFMLYSTFFRGFKTPNGEAVGMGYLWSYAPEAGAIGVGSTGGGADLAPGAGEPLTWDELSRDLRLAWYWNSDLYIFSLEGCVRQGFLARLKTFIWDQPILSPDQSEKRVIAWRNTLRTALWLSHNGIYLLLVFTASMGLLQAIRRYLKHRRAG